MKCGSAVTVIVFTIALCCSFTSCVTVAELNVPGENEVKINNISAEYFSIAQGYVGIKNYEKAASYFKLAMRSKSLHDSAYYEMGRCYALAKKWEDAKKVFSDIQMKDPENNTIAMSLAYIEAMSGNTKKAIEMYSDLVKKMPDDATVLKNYIAMLMADGKYELAERQYYNLKMKFPDEKDLPTILSKLADGLENVEKPAATSTSNSTSATTTEGKK